MYDHRSRYIDRGPARSSFPQLERSVARTQLTSTIETPDFLAFAGAADVAEKASSQLTMSSEHPELQFRGIRHPVFVPRRVPDNVHARVGDAGQLLQFVEDFDGKALGGGAAR